MGEGRVQELAAAAISAHRERIRVTAPPKLAPFSYRFSQTSNCNISRKQELTKDSAGRNRSGYCRRYRAISFGLTKGRCGRVEEDKNGGCALSRHRFSGRNAQDLFFETPTHSFGFYILVHHVSSCFNNNNGATTVAIQAYLLLLHSSDYSTVNYNLLVVEDTDIAFLVGGEPFDFCRQHGASRCSVATPAATTGDSRVEHRCRAASKRECAQTNAPLLRFVSICQRRRQQQPSVELQIRQGWVQKVEQK